MTEIIIILIVLVVLLLELILIYAVDKYITVQKLIRRATKRKIRELNRMAFEAEQEMLREARRSVTR